MSQQDIVRQRRTINILLLAIFCGLFAWVVFAVKAEIEHVYRANQPLTAAQLQVVREAGTIELTHVDDAWQMQRPYQHLASQAVVEALLMRLKNTCRPLNGTPARAPQLYADILIDSAVYRIGERNDAGDEVYVFHENQWRLCDQLVLSMALAPAINFIDKQLYRGKLTAIIGDFGRLSDFQGIDLSVMEIAVANTETLPEHAVSSLTFVADETRTYSAFLSRDSQHLLLFDKAKTLIYVVAANAKLNAVLGL